MQIGEQNRAGTNTAGGAPQWVAGVPLKEGQLTYNGGKTFRVQEAIANPQTAPTVSGRYYKDLSYDDTSIYALARSLGDRLDLIARFVTRWDLEKAVTLNSDTLGSIRYTSGQAFAFTPGSYAAGIIQLTASDYGRNGDLVAVRIAAGTRDLVFNAGAAEAFNVAGGPATIPALAGQQYIFHLVQPNPQQVTGSFWQVHSSPSTNSGTPSTAVPVPFGPFTATGAAGETFALPAGTQSVRGVTVLDASPQQGVHPALVLASGMYTLDTSVSPPTLAVKSPYALSKDDTIEGIAFTTAGGGGGTTPGGSISVGNTTGSNQITIRSTTGG